MALSTIIRQTCQICGKIAVEKSSVRLGEKRIVTLECGHITSEKSLKSQSDEDIATILNGCRLMPYQVQGVKFLQTADAKALLADEQGLGKTIQAAALLKLHFKELTPCIIVCPTTVKLQWMHELISKCDIKLIQVIGSTKEMAAPGFDVYVTTYDLLKTEKCFDLVKDKIKFIIIDECQRIKNHLSDRAKAVQKISKSIEHILPMSGTPIKNHAGEYFTVLNLVRPRLYPHYANFIDNECDSYRSPYGYKVGGLKYPEQFHEDTKEFILRRTKAEVLKDLPELMRKFHHAELNPKLNKAYAEALKELDDLLYDNDMNAMERNSKSIAIMTKMRQITGIGKVQTCVDWVTEFLMSCDRKLTIFVHHHVVADMLIATLNKWLDDGGFKSCLHMSASLDADHRENLARKFKEQEYRVMIASTLAAGEGINLQFCSDAIMMERQWNPANEEQAEGRFHRFGQTNTVSVTYMIASETIDEYFTTLVENKRAIVSSTLDNREIQWDQQSLMKELAQILVTKGKSAWKL